jgi:hypothetical protein
MITIMLKTHVQFDGKKLYQFMILWSSCSGIHPQFDVKKLYHSISFFELQSMCNLRCVLCFVVLHVHEDVRPVLQVPSKAHPLICHQGS